MLQYSGHFVYFPGPECQAIDQAYACLYLASKMGRAVKGQVLQVCNGAFLWPITSCASRPIFNDSGAN